MAQQRTLQIRHKKPHQPTERHINNVLNTYAGIFWSIVFLLCLWPIIHYTNAYERDFEVIHNILRNLTKSVENVSSVQT
jgi:hypothetical protein